jgi:phytoene/squalene synthetase
MAALIYKQNAIEKDYLFNRNVATTVDPVTAPIRSILRAWRLKQAALAGMARSRAAAT